MLPLVRATALPLLAAGQAAPAGPVFDSEVVSAETPGHAVEIDVDVAGAERIFLVALDAGDGILCDFADWAEPRFVGPGGETRLTEIAWRSAWTDNGVVSTATNCEGGPLTIDGVPVGYGIGSHANSLIVFGVPAGTTRFRARAGIDSQGPDEGIGGATLRFQVWLEEPAPPVPSRRPGPVERERSPLPAAPAQVTTLPGFRVELVHEVPREAGSWVSLAIDPAGRIVASPQFERGLWRVTPAPIGGSPAQTVVERLEVPIGGAHGLVWAFDSLYAVVADGPDAHGVYRLRDGDGDLQPDCVELLLELTGGGEHGPHGIVLGPRGDALYFVCGDGTRVPDRVDVSRTSGPWQVDQLLPPLGEESESWEAGPVEPGGWICRIAPDGSWAELVCSGLRNSYDLAFDERGDLFTFDSDMEYDMGLPWYRPTRVCFVPSGADFGWRGGVRNWATYAADGLPGVHDVGPASPTGLVFGYGTRFPAPYQEALFALDWTFGTIHAIHLARAGAGYVATREDFVTGAPLPVTDAVVGKDGSLYFAVGGRRTTSALYRVVYEGRGPTTVESSAASERARAQADELHAARARLEGYHGRPDAGAVDAAWPYLGHLDRFLRFAARVALEHQPVEAWRERALAEPAPLARIHALLALARRGAPELRPRIAAALDALAFGELSTLERTDLLRAYAVLFARMGAPGEAERSRVLDQLDAHFPCGERVLDRELARVLAYLEAPRIAERILSVMDGADPDAVDDWRARTSRNMVYGGPIEAMRRMRPHEERVHYADLLRHVRGGWTGELRRRFFRHVGDAIRESRGGYWYRGAWEAIRADALGDLPDDATEQREELEALASGAELAGPPLAELPRLRGPGEAWTVGRLAELVAARSLAGRDPADGERAWAAATCVVCHRVGGEGGSVGPDLTTLASRFSARDAIEAIVEPDRVVADGYRGEHLVLADGRIVTGRVVDEDEWRLRVMTDMHRPFELTVIERGELALREESPRSPMPAGLLDAASEEEVLDLLAYLLSGGDPGEGPYR